jgi:hypothetical protein
MSKFTINTETYSIIQEMSDSEVGKLFKAVYDYQINGTEVSAPEVKIAFKVFLMGFEKDKELSMARSKSGSMGGRPAESKQKQTKAKKANPDEDQVVKTEKNKIKFIETLEPYKKQYGADMLNAFFKYWTEPNKTNTKMRFELEKTWSVDLRLSNWARNNKDIATTPKVEEIKYNRS